MDIKANSNSEQNEQPNNSKVIKDFSILDKIITSRFNRKPSIRYFIALSAAVFFSLIGIYCIVETLSKGLTIWNINNKVSWGITIANFVFWIGIGHAGTLISAILFLLNQSWRTSINRPAEAMTIFALCVAALFPLLHTGRPWFALYWLLPYPNQMGIWPNFKSPLVWDLFAIGIYLVVSIIFCYVGMIPDLSQLRTKLKSKKLSFLYTYLSLGWIGSNTQWLHYKKLYILLAGLITPLVIAVHTIVSLDFSVTLVPGWHSTIFPPYFVAGAIFSGCAIVIILSATARNLLRLEQLITPVHFNNLAKIMLATGWIIILSYILEFFFAFLNGKEVEINLLIYRMTGDYAFLFWIMLFINIILIQLLWLKRIRQNITAMVIISIFIAVGMWLERFVIVVTSLSNDYFASGATPYFPSLTEIGILVGSFGFFAFLYLIFIQIFPIISLNDIKSEIK